MCCSVCRANTNKYLAKVVYGCWSGTKQDYKARVHMIKEGLLARTGGEGGGILLDKGHGEGSQAVVLLQMVQ